MKMATKSAPRAPQFRKRQPVRSHGTKTGQPKDPRKSYEHYLALARAEAQNGDRIAAENYFQHAEHYLRSMHDRHA
jgi:hypothetical protein